MTYFKLIVTQWLAYLSKKKKKKKKDFLLILKALQILRILIFGKSLCPYRHSCTRLICMHLTLQQTLTPKRFQLLSHPFPTFLQQTFTEQVLLTRRTATAGTEVKPISLCSEKAHGRPRKRAPQAVVLVAQSYPTVCHPHGQMADPHSITRRACPEQRKLARVIGAPNPAYVGVGNRHLGY